MVDLETKIRESEKTNLVKPIENGNGVMEFLEARFPNIHKENWKGKVARTLSYPVKHSLRWMGDRKLPDGETGLRRELDYCLYGFKWGLSYGLISWVLGDQRSTTQKRIAKAIKLKPNYALTLGNIVTGFIGETIHVYNITGPLIQSSFDEMGLHGSADFVDKNKYLWMLGYSIVYVGGRTYYMLKNKTPIAGIGYKTLLAWSFVEGWQGKIETVKNIGKFVHKKTHYITDILYSLKDVYGKINLKNGLALGTLDYNLGFKNSSNLVKEPYEVNNNHFLKNTKKPV